MKKEVTKDFANFMCGIDIMDFNVVYDLWKAATGDIETLTFFTVEKAKGSEDTLITYIPTNNAIRLTSKAASYFPTWIEEIYMDDMDGESWYGFQSALDKAKDE